jgi:hypothetical protein
MRSTPPNFAPISTTTCRPTAHRLAVSLVALALAAGCSTTPDAPVSEEEVHEVTGTVPAWPGEATSSCGDRIAITSFSDDVGMRAYAETRVLLTSAQAYEDYFGHPAPAGVHLGREWVVFYAPGKATGGSVPGVNVVGVSGDVLHVVTTLTAPIPPCVPPVPGGGSGPGTMGMGGATTGAGGASGAGSNSSAGAPAPSGATAIAPAAPLPAPDSAPRSGLPYVLVKFAAQKTHSVDFQHQDINPGCGNDLPLPNPCAAILCKQGQTCIVLESYPPQARCVDTKPETRCSSTSDCGMGLRCSVERGDCQSCGGAPGTACPAICFGVCEPEPSSGGACTGGALMNQGCLSEAQWKDRAAEECKKQNLELVDVGVGNACFASGFAAAKYTCCTSKPTPPPSPPPADGSCKIDSDCRLTSSSCGQDPCTCRAQPVNQIEPSCPMTAVACLVDPCARQTAACVANRCVMQAAPKR